MGENVNSQEIKKTKVGFLEKIGFGGMAMTEGITSQFVTTFLLFFFTDALGLSPAIAGTIATIGMVWDGINDPMIGYYADHKKFKNGEKARPYALWIAIPTALSFLLLFTAFDLSPTMKIAYFMVIYLIYHLFITFFEIPGNVMRTLATDNEQERVSINTFSSAGANLGTVISTLLVWPLVELFGGLNKSGEVINLERGFFGVAAVLALLIVAGSFLFYFTSKERVRPKNPDTSIIPPKLMAKMLFSNKSWIYNMLFLMICNIHNLIISITVVYLANNVLNNANAVTVLMAGYLGGAVLVLPFIGLINKKLGRRNTMLATAIMLIITKFYFILTPVTLISAMSVAVFVGVGVSINLVTINTTFAEIADLIEHRHGRRIENMISAISTLFVKLVLALVTFVVGWTLQLTGYNATLEILPGSALSAIKNFFALVPLFAAVVMFIIAYFFPIEKEMAEMRREAERDDKEAKTQIEINI